MKRAVIIDYQLGNIFSVLQACEHCNVRAVVSTNPAEVLNSDYLILPGVGAFGDAMTSLSSMGLLYSIQTHVKAGKPLMGICLGMQLLMSNSEEDGFHTGLNFIKGNVKRFPVVKLPDSSFSKVPQIQWNQIKESNQIRWRDSPLKSLSSGSYMYFVHSYYVVPDNSKVILASSNYSNIDYSSAIQQDNICAFQFHPEKSGEEGLTIYKNFFQQ